MRRQTGLAGTIKGAKLVHEPVRVKLGGVEWDKTMFTGIAAGKPSMFLIYLHYHHATRTACMFTMIDKIGHSLENLATLERLVRGAQVNP